jgi:coenzyme F420-reducing hydrogenase gamma subunit
MADSRPTLAVWKFASCDGCQLTLLNCEAELLSVAEQVTVAYFPEATRAVVAGPYDLSLVEGSVTTPEDAERIQEVRAASRQLITIGACATSGGIQSLRDFADVTEFMSVVYAHPEYIRTLNRSTPISAHVTVDFQLRGCPIDRHQLLEVISAALQGRKPRIPTYSVCTECKRRGIPCVAVADGMACLGPVTQAGCGALCPSYHRGCYGCFGPQDTPNAPALAERLRAAGMAEADVIRTFRQFTAGAEPFRAATTPTPPKVLSNRGAERPDSTAPRSGGSAGGGPS